MSQSLAEKLRRQLSSKNATKNITSILVFGAIVLVFVFFGFPGRNGGVSIGYVARVNNSLVTMADFQNQERQISEQMSSLFGGQMPFGAQQNQFKQQALNQLIRFELASQAAQKEGIMATDGEIRDYITKDIPAFQENGQFVRERYSNYLAYMHMNPGDFEAKLRKEIINQRLVRLFEASNVDNKLAADQTNRLKSQKMNVQFLKINREALVAGKKYPADVVAKNLAQKGFKKRVEDRFNLMKSRFDQAEQVHAQHILITFKQGDGASEQAALAKIKEVQAQVKGGNFAELAKKYSQDPGSAKKGGDLGFFTQGKMVPEFDKVAFSQKVGEVSAPVRSEFGYHLIKVIEKKDAKTAQLKDYENQVAQQVLAEDELDKDLKDLEAALAAGKTDAVAAFQKTWGLSWQETGYFDMSQDAITQLPVEDISFVTELSPEKPWGTKLLSSRGSDRVLVKLKDMKTEAPGKEVAAAASGADYVKRQKTFGFYDGFIRQFEKHSTIQVNQEALPIVETSFHIEKAITLIESQGSLRETWLFGFGVSGPIDSESGMILNLVHAEKILLDLILEYQERHLQDFLGSVQMIMGEAARLLSQWPKVTLSSVHLRTTDDQRHFCWSKTGSFYRHTQTAVWNDEGVKSLFPTAWTTSKSDQNQLLLREINAVTEWSGKKAQELLSANLVVKIEVGQIFEKSWRVFQKGG